MTTQNLVQGGEAGHWDQAISAFLAEKERRSGSMRTVRAYSGMLYRFFGNLGKPPDRVTAAGDAFWGKVRSLGEKQYYNTIDLDGVPDQSIPESGNLGDNGGQIIGRKSEGDRDTKRI